MPDVLTGGMLAISLFSANEGRKAGNSANDLQARELQLAIERDKFNKGIVEEGNDWTREDRTDFLDRQDREREMLDPVQQGIVDRANKGPDFEGAAARSDADVAQSYGIERQKMQRQNQRYGVNPSSGRMSSENRRFGNAEALAKTYGRNRSHLQEDDRDWARKIAALGTGNTRNATPNANLSQLGVSGAQGVLGSQAGDAASNANAAYGLAGSLFADATDRFDNKPAAPTPNGSATVVDQNNWD